MKIESKKLRISNEKPSESSQQIGLADYLRSIIYNHHYPKLPKFFVE